MIRVRHIEDLDTYNERMGEFRDEWMDIRQSLYLAVENKGMTPIKRRTPQSSRKRYPNRIDSGNQNLLKSIKMNIKSNTGSEIKVFVGSTGVDYAAKVHEMPDPHPNGRPVNWTKVGTGNKYIQKPLEDNRDTIPEDMLKEIDRRIERLGL